MYLYGPIHGTTLPHKPDRPRRRRLPPEAFYATAEPCGSCGEQTYRGRIWNAEHELWAAVDCSCNVPDVLPSCPTRYALVCEAATINQMCLALRAHEAALVAATLIATSASEFFTQDVEDADSFGRNIDTGSHPPGTREAQEYVRDRKLEEFRPKPAVPVKPDAGVKPWRNFGEMRRVFEQIREQVGETCYREELERAGVQNPGQFQSASRALECYGRLARIAAQPEVA